MITVAEALARVFALMCAPVGAEDAMLTDASGRVLAGAVRAGRAHPPFAASAMDGYAVVSGEVGEQLRVIGQSVAGAGFNGSVGRGAAVRIFTGAPIPDGAERVIIQEDCQIHPNSGGGSITIKDSYREAAPPHIRPLGADFAAGFTVQPPLRLGAAQIGLLAAMGCAEVSVRRKPRIALVCMGNELVELGETPAAHQIISSNGLALRARLQAEGATAHILPIAQDTPAALREVLAQCGDADLIVTIGGASVGEHDMMGQLARDGEGTGELKTAFYKVAMRPGKPMMAGEYFGMAGDGKVGGVNGERRSTPLLGLPGNPVSAMVCAEVVLIPAVRMLLGFPPSPRTTRPVLAGCAIPANGQREHYMRAQLRIDKTGERVFVFDDQDSGLLSVMEQANCLIVRPPNAPEVPIGDAVQVLIIN